MNSFQLKRILETGAMTKHAFQGVYASDKLKRIPKPSTLPATYVINEDSRIKTENTLGSFVCGSLWLC